MPQGAFASATLCALCRCVGKDILVTWISDLWGKCMVTFIETEVFPISFDGGFPHPAATADFDGDGRIEFVPTPQAPNDLAQRLGARLQQWTGNRWAVTLVNDGGAPTIAADRDAEENALKVEATTHPMVQAALKAFPKAKIADIRTPEELIQEAAFEALPEVEDEWDPFEDG